MNDSSAAERIKASGRFDLDDIPLLVSVINLHDLAFGSPWDDFRHAHLSLPPWFRDDLDPLSSEYAEQQHRLWSLLAEVSSRYQPEVDELEAPLANVDAIRRPGYFVRRDPEAITEASEHLLATSMILRHSGRSPATQRSNTAPGLRTHRSSWRDSVFSSTRWTSLKRFAAT